MGKAASAAPSFAVRRCGSAGKCNPPLPSSKAYRAGLCWKRWWRSSVAGKVYVNRRHDNHREDLCSYQVFRFGDLRDVIVPFFQANPLRTAKRDNFAKFVEVIRLDRTPTHLTVPGLIEIAEIVETMNYRKHPRC